MTVTVQKIIDDAGVLLNDTLQRRHSADELVGWLNEGILVVASRKPDSVSTTITHPLTAGTRQALPSDSDRLIRVIRNMSNAVCYPLDFTDEDDSVEVFNYYDYDWTYNAEYITATQTQQATYPPFMVGGVVWDACADVSAPNRVWGVVDMTDVPPVNDPQAGYIGVATYIDKSQGTGYVPSWDCVYLMVGSMANNAGLWVQSGNFYGGQVQDVRNVVPLDYAAVKITLDIYDYVPGSEGLSGVQVLVDDTVLFDWGDFSGLRVPDPAPFGFQGYGIVGSCYNGGIMGKVTDVFISDSGGQGSFRAKEAVNLVDMDTINLFRPSWHTDVPESIVKDYMHNHDDPNKFYIHPPNDGSGYVDLVYAKVPEPVTADGNLSLEDVFATPLIDYVVARAFAAEREEQQYARAKVHYKAFAKALGMDTDMDTEHDVNETVEAE